MIATSRPCKPLLAAALFLPAILFCLPGMINAMELAELKPYYRKITLTGFTAPKREMTLSSEVNGRIKEMFADIGEQVPESGRFAEIDSTFLRLDIEANIIAQERTARQLAQDQKTLDRYTTLLDQQSTPQAQLEEVSLAADLHRLTLKQLKNEAARLQEQLTRHTLKAPQGWKVIARLTEPGEFIQAGKPVVRLGDFRQLIVPFAVTYNELQSIMEKKQLTLFLPDVGATVPATNYRQSPVFDAATRKIVIDLLIQAEQPELQVNIRGGMRAALKFSSTAATQTFLIPRSSLINRYETFWLITPDGTRISVVFIGYSEDDEFAIISGEGLAPGRKFQLNPASLQ